MVFAATYDRSLGFRALTLAVLVASFILFNGLAPFLADAQTDEELERQIAERNRQIQLLEAEIAKYETELQDVSAERQTLESAVRQLDLSLRKLAADVNVTENRIGAAELEVTELEREIASKQASIDLSNEALGAAIRNLHEADTQSFVEAMLSSDSLAGAWDEVDTVQQFQIVLRTRLQSLTEIKVALESAKEEEEATRENLLEYQDTLVAQRQSVDINRAEKNELLEETEAEESNYQQLLADKREAKEAFEAELAGLESQLSYNLDPDRIPPAGKGILRWPLDAITVTQHFGNTAFAASGAYSGKGHNGVDFRASVGTPVRAALSGTVVGAGNTDKIPGCWSYGGWILVRHANGLSTLYAHLSQIAVSSGSSVETGQVIGFSGNTGYSTGPHLHFSVFASGGVDVTDLGSWYRQNGQSPTTACSKGGAIIPVAAYSAYLNPMDYL